MKMEVTENTLVEEFRKMGRGDQFSRRALELLLEYYNEITPEMELDVIGICCDWTEYKNLPEALDDYGYSDKRELLGRSTVLTDDIDDGIVVVSNH